MPTLQFVQPSEEQRALMQEFRDSMEAIYRAIEEKVPASRGRSSSLTKLEEASFWLNKGITGNS